MTITEGQIVSLDYILSIKDGDVVESSKEEGPLEYLHGNGEIPEGLEVALEGKAVGDKIELTLQPQDAFGEYDLEALTTVPRSEFPDDAEIETDQWIQVGVQMEDEEDDGEFEIEMRIVEINTEAVVLDANHPLAGKTIEYKVEVREFHPATEEEIADRHIHDENCGH